MTKIQQADSQARHVIVSMNPKSGASDQTVIVNRLIDYLIEYRYDVQRISEIDQLCQTASQLLQENKLRCVVSAGGDGTASLLVNRLPAAVPLAVLPLGTANLLANYLQVKRDPRQIADIIRNGKSVLMDVGRANGTLFLVVASCGFDAAVVERLHKNRKGHITYWTYSIPILKSIWKYKYPKLRFVADGKSIPSARWAFVLNAPRYAMNLNFIEEADTQDGHLDICTFKNGGLLRGLYYLFSVIFRRHKKIRESYFVRFKSLTIEADEPVPYELDGDPGGYLPLRVEAVPERMLMMVSDDWLDSSS